MQYPLCPWLRRMCIAVAVAATIAVLISALAAGLEKPCCFTNSRYEGVCSIIPGETETCPSILAYLNNPMSTGKSYCGGTSIRGGWIQVDCKTGKSIMQLYSAQK